MSELTAEQIAALISGPEGYQIGLFLTLVVYRLENGQYGVYVYAYNKETGKDDLEDEYLFGEVGNINQPAAALEAAKLFIKKREEMMLGFDYETGKR